MRLTAVCLLALAACTDRSRPSPVAAPSAAVADASVAVTPPADAGTTVVGPQLPASDFGPRGPLVVVGYPTPISDAAESASITDYGITEGGFAYCEDNFGDMATGATHSECVWNDGTKSTRIPEVTEPKTRKIYATDHHLLPTTFASPKANPMPPKVTGDWRYARDLAVHVQAITKEPGSACDAPASFRIGGAVKGEKPVWFTTVTVSVTNPCNYIGDIQAIALSPDGFEFGAAFRALGAHSDSEQFGSYYAHTFHLAAQIYNDTGFRHHKAKDYARAAELFLLAANADPEWDMAAYNLACAWNRAGDPRAALALDVAIARGGEKVKARAAKDDDLKSLKR